MVAMREAKPGRPRRLRKEYRTIKIPAALWEQVEALVEAGVGGYTSVAEFVKAAIRALLKETAKT